MDRRNPGAVRGSSLPKRSFLLCALAAFLFVVRLHALPPSPSSEDEAAKKEKTSGLAFLPIIFYTPETHWAFGGGGLYYFRLTRDPAVSRPSNIMFIAVHTQKKQTNLEMNPDFYLKKGLHIQTKFQYSDFPDQFYGIGNETTEDMEEPFTSKFWKLSVVALKRVRGPLNIGFQYFFDDTKLKELKEGGKLASGAIPGSAGGTVSGFGCFLTYDSRDSIFYPTAGSFHQFSAMAFGQALGSDFTFNRIYFDLRRYVRLSYAHCLAFQTRF